MFLAKKIIGSLLQPLPLSLIVVLIGVYLIWFSRHKKLGHLAIGLALVMIMGFSTPMVANNLIKPLEQQYPAIINASRYTAIQYVVVLGGGHLVDDKTPISSHLGNSALKRLIEGIRLQKALSNATLIVSGGAVFSKHREADTMAALIKALGLDNDELIVENNSRDTASQAQEIAKLVADKPFLLVTSAVHMPRSMRLMRQHNLNPIAAPTDYKGTNTRANRITAYLPDSGYLQRSETAIHEYFGTLWAILRQQ